MPIVLTAYANSLEYRARNNRIVSDDDTEIDAQLLGISRHLDKVLGVHPGAFNPQTALTFVFSWRHGDSTRLRLRDELDQQYFLRAITADSLKVDSNGDGVYDDYLFDLADLWVRGYPANQAALGEPYTAVELFGGRTGATLSAFPTGRALIEITGDWGWAAVPTVIKDSTIILTRRLRDTHEQSATAQMANIEASIQMVPGYTSFMRDLQRQYDYKIPAFA